MGPGEAVQGVEEPGADHLGQFSAWCTSVVLMVADLETTVRRPAWRARRRGSGHSQGTGKG